MAATFDLSNDDLRRSLAETISWCATQQITATVEETEEVKQRRRLGRQAGELIRSALVKYDRFRNKFFRRDYTKSREWMRGMELYRQADLESIARPLADQLRTPALKPSRPIQDTPAVDRENLVRSVIVKRGDLLRSLGQSISLKVGDDLGGGRLLLYSPDENFADGTSEYSSSGFFDVFDAPPWDIWVAYSDEVLLSWVPPQLIELAESGIDVNAVDCIHWLQ